LEPLGASGDKDDRLKEAEVQRVIEAMNENVFSTFCSYAAACTQDQPLTASDTTLPYSSVPCKAETSCWAPTSGLKELFSSARVECSTRGPFAALAGTGDTFSDPYDLVDCVRRDLVRLDAGSLPLFLPEGRGSKKPERANSWVLDLYLHGKLVYLTSDNGISAAQSWQLVKDFVTALKMIKAALEQISPEQDPVTKVPNDLVRRTHEQLYDIMEDRLHRCN
jgi:hypothetical protein